LYSYAKSKTTILADARNMENILELFHLPFSQQAFEQFNQLQQELEFLNLNNNDDSWTCMWDSGKFTVAKVYKHLSGHRTIHPSFSWIWKCSCQNKHKVFAWLILKDRLSTRELLKRKNMELQDYTCVLCSQSTEETLFHLLIDCPFASACWNWLGLQVTDQEDLYQYLESFRWQLHVPFFMEIIILICWTIWQMRNGLIFRNIPPSLQEAKRAFKSEFALLLHRAKRSYFPVIDQWLNNLV
jgi:hypothetical protein